MENSHLNNAKFIKKGNFWILNVDGYEIVFKGNLNKEYLENLYSNLNYEIINVES
jgi:hypothetical protein